MSDTPLNLAALLDLTDRVQAAIHEGDWQRAASLENERRAALARFLKAEVEAHGGLQHLDDSLYALQARNHKLIGEVHHHRRRLLRQASTVQTGRKAVAAYANTPSDVGIDRT